MSELPSTQQLDVFNPYAPGILDIGLRRILDETQNFSHPFLQLLGARWLHAQQHDQSGRTRTVAHVDRDASNTIVVPDFFVPNLLPQLQASGSPGDHQRDIIVFSDLPSASRQDGFRPAGLNGFLSARSGSINQGLGFHYACFAESGAINVPVIPMGCGQSWLPEAAHYEKVIFLDEPHPSLVERWHDREDVRVALFRHALEICRILHQRGFRIVTFSRFQLPELDAIYAEHSYLEIITIGSWIAFSELASHYSRCSLFFSWIPETHCYPIYENMQLGNGIVTYSETFDPYRILQMQRGVLLSVYNSPNTCASQVEEFFDRYVSKKLRQKIREAAFRCFSADTFFARLRASAAFAAASTPGNVSGFQKLRRWMPG